MNKVSEFHKYANYYLAQFIKAAAPYRDNTVPAGSVLANDMQTEINKKINRNTYKTLHPYEFVSALDDVPTFNAQEELNKKDPLVRNNIKKRIKKDNRNIKKEVYKKFQPRPGQPLRDYQKAQTENYNALVDDTIKELRNSMQYLDKRNAQVNDFMPTANNASGTVGGGLYGVSRFGDYNKNFRRTNNAYKSIESERQALLPYVAEKQRDFIANIPTTINGATADPGTAGDFAPTRIRISDHPDGSIVPGSMIHEGIHGYTATTEDTPVARRINTNVVDGPDGKPQYQWKNRLRNELRSINGTDRIFDDLSELAPVKQREAYKNSSRSSEYKNELYAKAKLDRREPINYDDDMLGYSDANKITNNIIKNKKGINVGKILDIEPADKEWNNTYAQGFGKAYKENPEAIDWLMEEKTKNYRLKPTATGKDRWNRASKKNKKSSILDNIEIALEKDKDNADLLDWYRKNREDINYQYGVAKAVNRHERKAKRKKLDRKEWAARRKAKGKTAGYYPAWLQYMYS